MYSDIHKEIVEQCKSGSRKAQFELYTKYSKAMYNVCLRMLKNEHDAEDILQNTFVDIFTKLDSFAFQSTIGAWMKRITVNNCINHLKSKKIQLEELGQAHHDKYEEDASVPIGLSVEIVQKAMNYLSDGYRIVFSLYAIEGYDHEEISQILGISESTSKSQYSRAKQRLREIFKEQKL